MKKTNFLRKNAVFWARLFALAAGAAGVFCACDGLQKSLHDEKEASLQEEIGIAQIDGDTWYYNGVSGDEVSGSSGTSLLITLSKNAVIPLNEDDCAELGGSLKLSYNSKSESDGEKVAKIAKEYQISKGKILGEKIYAEGSFDGTHFPFCMDTVAKALGDSDGNMEVVLNLSGFVCAEGEWKGRALSGIEKKLKVRPLYDETNITFYTAEEGERFVIPTNGPVKGDLKVESGDESAAYTFTACGSGEGIALAPSQNLQGKNYSCSVTISGILPASSGSTYEKTFALNFKNPKLLCENKEVTLVSEGEYGWDKNALALSADDFADKDISEIIITVKGAKNVWTYYAETGGDVGAGDKESDNWTQAVTDATKISDIQSGGLWLCNGSTDTVCVTVYYCEKN